MKKSILYSSIYSVLGVLIPGIISGICIDVVILGDNLGALLCAFILGFAIPLSLYFLFRKMVSKKLPYILSAVIMTAISLLLAFTFTLFNVFGFGYLFHLWIHCFLIVPLVFLDLIIHLIFHFINKKSLDTDNQGSKNEMT